VRTPTVNNRKPSRQEWDDTVTAIGLSNDNARIGANAEYQREHYVFLRQQSLAMRQLSWEERLPRIKHWGSDFVANVAFAIFA
jgi:hypothetical protein